MVGFQTAGEGSRVVSSLGMLTQREVMVISFIHICVSVMLFFILFT